MQAAPRNCSTARLHPQRYAWKQAAVVVTRALPERPHQLGHKDFGLLEGNQVGVDRRGLKRPKKIITTVDCKLATGEARCFMAKRCADRIKPFG